MVLSENLVAKRVLPLKPLVGSQNRLVRSTDRSISPALV